MFHKSGLNVKKTWIVITVVATVFAVGGWRYAPQNKPHRATNAQAVSVEKINLEAEDELSKPFLAAFSTDGAQQQAKPVFQNDSNDLIPL